jgi:Mn2+/Fe2+ NRAMP family transporter
LYSLSGFLDVGAFATAGEAGAKFGLGLIWAMLLGTGAIILLLEMGGRFAAISGKTYMDAIRVWMPFVKTLASSFTFCH